MNTHGFSLTEVLVSLLLMTSTSLALLNQQWQVSQLFNQLQLHTQALTQLDNAAELILAEQFETVDDKRFLLIQSQTQHSIFLKITWSSLAAKDAVSSLYRHMVIS